MARKSQKLINYHTGKKTAMPKLNEVDYGEIVVRHNEETPELLIKVSESSFGVFQASGAVQTAISVAKSEAIEAASSFTITQVSGAEGRLNTSISNVASNVETLSGAVSSITENYVTTGNLSTTLIALRGEISAAQKAATDASSAYTDTQVKAAKEYSDNKLTAATATLTQSIKDVDNKVSTLSGNVHTRIEGLKTDLTNTINDKITNVYRYKGSCAYAALPTTGNVTGDVWNVTDAHDKFPAGTNYAWADTEWDALGGSVDLSPYATTTYVDGKIQEINQTNTDLKSDIDSLSSATKTLIDEVSAATKATYATKDDLKSTSGSIISDYTTAIGAAKLEAIGTASGYTDTQVSAAKNSVYSSATTAAAADATTKADAAYSSATTAAAASAQTLQNNINNVNNSVTGLSASTANIETTANSAIQTASIVDSATCKVSVRKDNTELKFDFSNLVIDCGDF